MTQQSAMPGTLSADTGTENLFAPCTVDEKLVCRMPFAYLKRHVLLPLRDERGRIILGMADPAARLLRQEISLVLEERVADCRVYPPETILVTLNKTFGESTHGDQSVDKVLGDAEDIGDALYGDVGDVVADLLDDASEAPFIRLMNMILAQAVRAGASDIHIEPYREYTLVRFRLDGVLYERHRLAKRHHPAIVSRIKVMARLNIAEKRLPQDGRIAIALGGRQVGLRVSVLPTSFGERVVLRLLEKSERVLSLVELGVGDEDLVLMHRMLKTTHGVILVTGPTGSGKTTTLYAVLQEIASSDKNILTIEDPVEYELEGVGQMQVNPKIGLNFADGLRSIVRQDPDVILIGEIRDAETASIAVQSALTGHLVFSTLHTNDAPGAVTRLQDMGVEHFLLASVLRAVVAQRLIRMLCPRCKRPAMPDEEELKSLGSALSLYTGQALYGPGGCEACMGTGYKGRRAVYEIMPVSEGIRRHIVARADAGDIRAQALSEGMHSLRHSGMVQVLRGLTTLSEVSRVTAE